MHSEPSALNLCPCGYPKGGEKDSVFQPSRSPTISLIHFPPFVSSICFLLSLPLSLLTPISCNLSFISFRSFLYFGSYIFPYPCHSISNLFSPRHSASYFPISGFSDLPFVRLSLPNPRFLCLFSFPPSPSPISLHPSSPNFPTSQPPISSLSDFLTPQYPVSSISSPFNFHLPSPQPRRSPLHPTFLLPDL